MGSDAMNGRTGRPIRVEEASGVLNPTNLTCYNALWIDPAPAVESVVDQYWHVHWKLEDHETIDQAVIDMPMITLTVEDGDVPVSLGVTGLQRRAWRRSISGSGDVFAVRLRPAGLAALSSLSADDVADATVPLTPELDAPLHDLMARIARERTTDARARAADSLIDDRLRGRRIPDSHLLANQVLDELRSRVYHRTGTPLSRRFEVSERTIQRALALTIGIGPKQAARRIRLQEAAKAIAVHGDDDLADIATRLGFTDQAHLTAEMRTATGMTPAAYRRGLRLTIAAKGH